MVDPWSVGRARELHEWLAREIEASTKEAMTNSLIQAAW
jgi:hypothetical protein